MSAPANAELTTLLEPRFLSDGRVVALDGEEKRLAVFSPTGTLANTIGRTGAGPGEFREPAPWIGLTGDTVVAGDASLGKAMLIDPVRGMLREIPLKSPLAGFFFTPIGMLDGCLVFTQTEWILPKTDSTFRPLGPVIRFNPRLGRTDTLFKVGGPTIVPAPYTSHGKTIPSTTTLTFARWDQIAVWRGGFVVAPNGPFALEYRNARGVITRSLTVAGPRRPVTRGIRSIEIDAQVQRMAGRRAEGGAIVISNRKEIESSTRFADSLPAIDRIAMLPDGSVWALDFVVGDSVPWSATLFGADGAILGRLQGEAGGRPVAWMRDRVLLQSKDDDGIITWRTFKILRLAH